MRNKLKVSSGTAAYFAAFLAQGLMAASLGPTLPSLAAHAAVNLSLVSILFPAKSVGVMLGSFFGGRSYDWLPPHKLMASVLFAMALILAFIPTAAIVWVLAAALLLLGITEGTLDAGGNTLIIWEHGEKVPPYMNSLHFFYGLGAFLAPLIVAAALKNTADVNVAFWALTVIFIPISVVIWRTPSPSARKAIENAGDGKLDVPLIVLVGAFMFLFVGAEMSYGSWIYTFAKASGIGTVTSSAYLTSFFWGALTLGRLVSIPRATRFKISDILLMDLILGVVSIGVVLAFPGSQIAVWTGTFLTGFAFASIFPTMYSLAGANMAITGHVSGWLYIGAGAGGMVLPWIIGQLFESIGPVVTIQAIFIDTVLALAVFLGMLWVLRRRRLTKEAAIAAEIV
jgi:FHS family Na+ dependent glucose MFS transporter 1